MGGFGSEGIKIEPAYNSNQPFVLSLWDCRARNSWVIITASCQLLLLLHFKTYIFDNYASSHVAAIMFNNLAMFIMPTTTTMFHRPVSHLDINIFFLSKASSRPHRGFEFCVCDCDASSETHLQENSWN